MSDNRLSSKKQYALPKIAPLEAKAFNTLVKRRFLEIFGQQPEDYNNWNENQDLRKAAEKKYLKR